MSENPSTIAARALVEGLIRHGVRHVVLCPGSRSAPLAYALARAEGSGRIAVHVRVDERSGAFTALGLAHFGPAAVVTTSGTAAANLHPALLEARHAQLGLIAITADRPHELRGVGANQTTDQVHMFGPEIRFVEIPAGAGTHSITNQFSRIAAVAGGAFAPPAPVHVNIAFREPLVPDRPGEQGEPAGTHGATVVGASPEGGSAEIDVSIPTVVVAGDGAGGRAAQFAEASRLPLLAEPSSGARGGACAIGPYQRVLATLGGQVEQAVVFGRPTLSRPVSGLLAGVRETTVVARTAQWVDVAGRANRVCADVRAGVSDPQWLARWKDEERRVSAGMDLPLAAAVVRRALGRGQAQVVIGSSMAIRYADIYAPAGSAYIEAPVWSARGLAGIDGTISIAGGIALASGPTRVILGDLTFAHDLGALVRGRLEEAPELQIVVLNDGGGGIFGRIEHGRAPYAGTFDRFFATPLDLDIPAIAAAHRFEYAHISGEDEIEAALGRDVRRRSIVEVTLPPVAGDSQETPSNHPG